MDPSTLPFGLSHFQFGGAGGVWLHSLVFASEVLYLLAPIYVIVSKNIIQRTLGLEGLNLQKREQ